MPGKFNLYKLNVVIQMAMGWTNSHLHQFIIKNVYYSDPQFGLDFLDAKNEERFKLQEIAPKVKCKFVYEYDFGDCWSHTVLVEKIFAPEKGAKYPIVIKGRRACPPEDSGGIWGYESMLGIVADPQHPEHKMYLEWLPENFDPEKFDQDEIDAINAVLARVK